MKNFTSVVGAGEEIVKSVLASLAGITGDDFSLFLPVGIVETNGPAVEEGVGQLHVAVTIGIVVLAALNRAIFGVGIGASNFFTGNRSYATWGIICSGTITVGQIPTHRNVLGNGICVVRV